MSQLFPHASLDLEPNSVGFVFDENVPEKLKEALEKFNDSDYFQSEEAAEYENAELIIPALIKFITEDSVENGTLTEEEANEFADLDNLTVGSVIHLKHQASAIVMLYYSDEDGSEQEDAWD